MDAQLCRRVTDKWKVSLGRMGEERAVQTLVDKGWTIEDRNWRSGRYSEIDIVAREPGGLRVFVEVKSRCRKESSAGFQTIGFETLKRRKQQKLITSARTYMAHIARSNAPFRIDIIVVDFARLAGITDPDNLPEPSIIHVENAICC
ncbi:MAG TPA: YraN family protein [Candidatus Obscuribacterales bacterium]